MKKIDIQHFQKKGEGNFGAADLALDNSSRAVSAPDISAPFPNLFLFFELWRKCYIAGNFLNTVGSKPVETRVLNPTASETSHKPKQRSYRKTNLKKKVLVPDSPVAEMSGTETYPTRKKDPTFQSWL